MAAMSPLPVFFIPLVMAPFLFKRLKEEERRERERDRKKGKISL